MKLSKHEAAQRLKRQIGWQYRHTKLMIAVSTDLLSVVGCVGEHGGDMKHQLVVLVGGIERMCACGIRWNKYKNNLVLKKSGMAFGLETGILALR